MKNLKLEKIATKFSEINFNENNYAVGGGLTDGKFASNRHEDAKDDSGKLTVGEATQLFKKATNLDIDYIKSVIDYAVPKKEWHHAGKLPKQYGGGMKKTYFLNAKEIVEIANNFDSFCEKYEIRLQTQKIEDDHKRQLEILKQEFLTLNAEKKIRVTKKGLYFYETNCEMDGKYGWFCAYGKSYNMTEYFSGWEFSSEEKYHEFLNLK